MSFRILSTVYVNLVLSLSLTCNCAEHVRVIVLVCISDQPGIVMSCSPLVSCIWLRQHLQQGLKNLRLIDSSWYLSSPGGSSAKEDYNNGRINGSAFVDIDQLSDTSSVLPHMLPPTNQFNTQVGQLGITPDHHVIVYDNNRDTGMFSSARLWWMFKVFGHRNVSILDGGYQKWQEEGHPVNTNAPPIFIPTEYKAQFRAELVKGMGDVVQALREGKVQVVDARSHQRFSGATNEPRPGLPSGHMIGSINLPYTSFFNRDTKTLACKTVIHEEFSKAGVDLDKPIIATCGSGVTACWISFAASLLGKEIPVYDGSWTEYAVNGPTNTVSLSATTG